MPPRRTDVGLFPPQPTSATPAQRMAGVDLNVTGRAGSGRNAPPAAGCGSVLPPVITCGPAAR
jgi:hypothetical protein